MSQKSPQALNHVVKCEKWAYSTPKAGKNKPIRYITKTRDLKILRKKTKENRRCALAFDFVYTH